MSEHQTSPDVAVLIVGGGPIGLALAADLGRRGIEVVLVERRTEKLGAARMLEVGVRTMEFCRQLGIADEVRNWGFPLDHSLDSVFVTNLSGHELGRLKVPTLREHRASSTSPERTTPCPQTWFDPILRRHVEKIPNVRLRYQVELEDFIQDNNGVTAVLHDINTGEREEIRCQYLVGCDGSESGVRKRLGIEVRGRPHIDWSLNIYFRLPNFQFTHTTQQAFRYVFLDNNGTWSFLTAIDGKDLFRLQLLSMDKDALERTDIDAVVKRFAGRGVPYQVEDKVLWVRKMTIADRFSDGRVFLAGDAAHAHPPNGGLGMNTGIQDSFDLGWKLEAALKGWGGPAILGSYDLERRPACHRALGVSFASFQRLTSGSQHPDIEADTPEGEAARRAVGELLVSENQKAWQPPGAHLGHIYQPSSIVIPDHTPQPADDTFGYTPTAFPGARAPHFWLGPDRSIIDLFGKGFTLLKFDSIDTTALEKAADDRGVPFAVHEILNKQAADLYARKLVLVRPDGHVSWRDDVLPQDCLALIDVVRGAGLNIAARRIGDQDLIASTAKTRAPGTVNPDVNVVPYRGRDKISVVAG